MQKWFTKEQIPVIAREIIEKLKAESSNLTASILALSGDLGAGKTTLTQAIAAALGIEDNIVSPTFVIMKLYAPKTGWKQLVHIDAYRLNSAAELEKLGWNELIADPGNLILIEWPEQVPGIIPERAMKVSLKHVSEEEREIDF